MAAIPRKTAIILGGGIPSATGAVEGPLGSQAGGAVAYSLDPAVIQDVTNPASKWLAGVLQALIQTGGGLNSPTIQTLQAILLVLSQQIAYVLERGIPEWDSTGKTPYFGGDLVRRSVAGDQMTVYQVLSGKGPITSDPLTDTNNWQSYLNQQTSPLIPKAWVVFDGTGSGMILSSANVASLIRNSAGNYTVTFINALGANPGMAGNSQGLIRPISVGAASATFDTAILSGGTFVGHDYNFNSVVFFSP